MELQIKIDTKDKDDLRQLALISGALAWGDVDAEEDIDEPVPYHPAPKADGEPDGTAPETYLPIVPGLPVDEPLPARGR